MKTAVRDSVAVSGDQCRVRDVLDRVGDKWSVIVIYLLGLRTMRFTELLRSIDGISQRMLTVTLRGLERDGLVTRTVHAVVPPRVDYELTPMGRTLLAPMQALFGWSEEHTLAIDDARAAYDARDATGPHGPSLGRPSPTSVVGFPDTARGDQRP